MVTLYLISYDTINPAWSINFYFHVFLPMHQPTHLNWPETTRSTVIYCIVAESERNFISTLQRVPHILPPNCGPQPSGSHFAYFHLCWICPSLATPKYTCVYLPALRDSSLFIASGSGGTFLTCILSCSRISLVFKRAQFALTQMGP